MRGRHLWASAEWGSDALAGGRGVDWLLNVFWPVFAYWFWRGWIVAAVVVEVISLCNHARDDTLSEQVWRWMAIGKFIGWMICAFLFWLLVHFASRGKLA